ncbi:MAG: serpin family protein [Actinobacteria bacterium]|nr:serpin family protein [Actinomycetota bacterium]
MSYINQTPGETSPKRLKTSRIVTGILMSVIVVMSMLAGIVGCKKSGGGNQNGDGGSAGGNATPPTLGELPQSLDRLSIEFHKQVASEDGPRNIFLSPVSLEMALAMTMNGADGETRTAMENTLQMSGMSAEEINRLNKDLMNWLEETDPEITLDIANSLWGRQDIIFSDEFLNLNKDYYDAEVQNLDFQSGSAAKTINKWVSDNTNDKITEIIKPPISPQTILLLLNAIYFKGTWTSEFDKSQTRDMKFTTAGGEEKDVPMMFNSGDYRYMENEQFQAVRLPYGDDNVAMYVFLPKDTQGLESFIENLNAEEWNTWMTQFSQMEGDIRLPRLKIEYEKTLNDALTTLGMGIAFTDQADFMKMIAQDTITDPIRIKTVKQKTYVDVNEEGTEAAAVTSVEMELTAVPEPSERFEITVDHPFFFVIRDDPSGANLFTGSIVDPS